MWIYPGFNIISTFDLAWSNSAGTLANKRSISHGLSICLWRILLLYSWRDFTLKVPHEEVRPGTKCAQIMVPRLWNNGRSIILGNDKDLNIQVGKKCVDTHASIIASDSLRENPDPEQSPWQSAWSSHIGSRLKYAIEVEPKSLNESHELGVSKIINKENASCKSHTNITFLSWRKSFF